MKLAIWLVTALGLVPVIYLCVAGASLLWVGRDAEQKLLRHFERAGLRGLDTHLHDSYVSVGSARIDWYPRGWALGLAALGVVLIIGALVVLLHVPES